MGAFAETAGCVEERDFETESVGWRTQRDRTGCVAGYSPSCQEPSREQPVLGTLPATTRLVVRRRFLQAAYKSASRGVAVSKLSAEYPGLLSGNIQGSSAMLESPVEDSYPN